MNGDHFCKTAAWTRRTWLNAAAAVLAMPFGAIAQPQAAVPRIGMLSSGSAGSGALRNGYEQFLNGLRELGYVQGKNIGFEWRYGDGKPERLRPLAAELIELDVAMIVAGGPACIEAARAVTSRTPILAVGGSDPVGEGWARSLAHPGGNVTGLTVTYPELGAKRLGLLKQAAPAMARTAVMLAPSELDAESNKAGLLAGARAIGLELLWLEVGSPADFESAFMRSAQDRADGFCALGTNLIVTHRRRLAELALQQRLPSISDFPIMAQAGFLTSYGADLAALYGRSVLYVDKILKGARPGDLPIERPTRMELVFNLATARTIGLTLPEDLVRQANRLIE